MPLYKLGCPKCGYFVEEIMKYEEAKNSPPQCHNCHLPLEIQPAAAHFVLKGTGFHKNDYPT